MNLHIDGNLAVGALLGLFVTVVVAVLIGFRRNYDRYTNLAGVVCAISKVVLIAVAICAVVVAAVLGTSEPWLLPAGYVGVWVVLEVIVNQ